MSKEKLEELENEEVEEDTEEETTPAASTPSNDLKDIVVKECTRIIDQYIDICKGNNDTAFIEALDNPDKTKENCVNHIMNNLTSKRIYGGADSLMYEFIHEYYVDKFTEVKDDWSKWMRTPSGNTGSSKKVDENKIKADALKEAKKQLEAEYGKMDIDSIKKQAITEFKASEKAKKEEQAKLKEVEKKRKEEEARKKAESKANEPLGGLFDLL